MTFLRDRWMYRTDHPQWLCTWICKFRHNVIFLYVFRCCYAIVWSVVTNSLTALVITGRGCVPNIVTAHSWVATLFVSCEISKLLTVSSNRKLILRSTETQAEPMCRCTDVLKGATIIMFLLAEFDFKWGHALCFVARVLSKGRWYGGFIPPKCDLIAALTSRRNNAAANCFGIISVLSPFIVRFLLPLCEVWKVFCAFTLQYSVFWTTNTFTADTPAILKIDVATDRSEVEVLVKQ